MKGSNMHLSLSHTSNCRHPASSKSLYVCVYARVCVCVHVCKHVHLYVSMLGGGGPMLNDKFCVCQYYVFWSLMSVVFASLSNVHTHGSLEMERSKTPLSLLWRKVLLPQVTNPLVKSVFGFSWTVVEMVFAFKLRLIMFLSQSVNSLLVLGLSAVSGAQ